MRGEERNQQMRELLNEIEAGEWIEKGRKDGSGSNIRVLKESRKILFMVRVI